MKDWRARAACRGVDPSLFFPAQGGNSFIEGQAAKRVCDGCPVAGECLEFALVEHLPDGIYGGKSPNERRALTVERRNRVA